MDTTRTLLLLIVPTLIVLAVLALKDRALTHLLTRPLREWGSESATEARLMRLEGLAELAMEGQRWLAADQAVTATEVRQRLTQLEAQVDRLMGERADRQLREP